MYLTVILKLMAKAGERFIKKNSTYPVDMEQLINDDEELNENYCEKVVNNYKIGCYFSSTNYQFFAKTEDYYNSMFFVISVESGEIFRLRSTFPKQ